MKNKVYIFALMFVLLLSFAAAQAEPGYNGQIELIAANSDLWKQDVEYNTWGYVITDLDQNNRLEILSCSVQGTGFYSYIKAYEVNEDGTSLKNLMEKLEERTDSSPDIMVTSVPVYSDTKTGRLFYIFDDMIRNGMAEYYENKRAVTLNDGLWEETPLAHKTTIYTDADHAEITYTDGSGNTISETQYASIADIVFAGMEPGKACLNWITTDNEDFAALSNAQLIENLNSSAQSTCQD